MHYSAKRGIAIACLSVCPSVMLVDQEHIGWKSWKLIIRTSPTSSLFVFVAQRPSSHPPTSRGTWENFEETRGWVGKSGVLEHKSGNIFRTRKNRGKEKLPRRSYRHRPVLFQTVRPSTASSFPKIGGSQLPPKTPNLKFRENEC